MYSWYAKTMEAFKDVEIRPFKDQATWEKWLSSHYNQQAGVWIKFAKKNSGIPTVSYAEALDVALCYGWIDGQSRSYDDTWYLQKFTPRRARSLWSKINIAKVEALIAAGKMQPAGQAAIDAAKADGRWDAAYASQKDATVPDDLAAELAKDKGAQEFFESLTKANQYAFLWRLMTAKTPATRASRLEKMVTMLKEGKSFH